MKLRRKLGKYRHDGMTIFFVTDEGVLCSISGSGSRSPRTQGGAGECAEQHSLAGDLPRAAQGMAHQQRFLGLVAGQNDNNGRRRCCCRRRYCCRRYCCRRRLFSLMVALDHLRATRFSKTLGRIIIFCYMEWQINYICDKCDCATCA